VKAEEIERRLPEGGLCYNCQYGGYRRVVVFDELQNPKEKISLHCSEFGCELPSPVQLGGCGAGVRACSAHFPSINPEIKKILLSIAPEEKE